MLAQPRTGSDWVKTSMTNLHGFRFMQSFLYFFVPRVQRRRDLSRPDENAPQEDERRNGQSNFADKTLRRAGHSSSMSVAHNRKRLQRLLPLRLRLRPPSPSSRSNFGFGGGAHFSAFLWSRFTFCGPYFGPSRPCGSHDLGPSG